ncbi:MAG: FixH family protein [Alphaproteobacteria bacterium]
MAMTEKPVQPLTGWHLLAMFIAFFGVIIAVNGLLVWKAVSTFPGLDVENGYVASQSFDREMAAQKALNWTLKPTYDASANQMQLAFTDAAGRPATLADLTVLIGRTTEAVDDQTPTFTLQNGVYVAPVVLPMGKWMMAVQAHAADGTLFHQRIDLYVNR